MSLLSILVFYLPSDSNEKVSSRRSIGSSGSGSGSGRSRSWHLVVGAKQLLLARLLSGFRRRRLVALLAQGAQTMPCSPLSRADLVCEANFAHFTSLGRTGLPF